ncbi:hypothetical protein ACLOJK_017036 [Asimina triloba]
MLFDTSSSVGRECALPTVNSTCKRTYTHVIIVSSLQPNKDSAPDAYTLSTMEPLENSTIGTRSRTRTAHHSPADIVVCGLDGGFRTVHELSGFCGDEIETRVRRRRVASLPDGLPLSNGPFPLHRDLKNAYPAPSFLSLLFPLPLFPHIYSAFLPHSDETSPPQSGKKNPNMGACISKKGVQDEKKISSSSISTAPQSSTTTAQNPLPAKPAKDAEAAAVPAAPAVVVKNPIHVSEIKKDDEQSNEAAEEPKRSGVAAKDCSNAISAATVRTSSCTKEEVDAILIQCGRLSRSSSGKGLSENGSRSGVSGSGSRKYSGSKRSYDFDNDPADNNNRMEGNDEMPQIRLTHRRTPSRERDGGSSELKRSSSRDEGRRSGSRRASRSPGRRQEAPVEKTRPGKMVSVPATVSAGRDTGRRGSAATKRSGEVGGRSNASPRARSPANTRPSADQNAHHHNSQPSLSRNSSKKTEQSPYRRNPMNEIDGNVVRNEQPPSKNQDRGLTNAKGSNVKPAKNTDGEEGLDKTSHLQQQKSNENEILMQRSNENGVRFQKSDDRNIPAVDVSNKADRNTSAGIREQLMNCRQKEQQREPEIMEEPPAETKAVAEDLNRPTLTRSRSSRRSRDLDLGVDLNPDSLNPPTYASLLLEDIQNYHQQNSVAAAAFSLPACVSKARSILEAVADLNSCTTSNLSSGFSEYKSEADPSEHHNCSSNSFGGRLGKRRATTFVESEMAGVNENDLMEPSLHKYVTVRNAAAASEMEPQESAGSNSFLGHHWISSWEPNSADSTERWASASNASEEVEQKTLMNEVGHDDHHELGGPRRLKRGGSGSCSGLGVGTASAGGKKRDFSFSQQGGSVGSGKMGIRSSSSLPVVAAAAQ